MSLVLHVWLVARLFLLFPLKIRQHSPLPFLTCIVFATSAIASGTGVMEPCNRVSFIPAPDFELYYVSPILFVAKRHSQSCTISSFALMAQFTHELGVLYSGLVAVFLLWENIKRYWRQTGLCICMRAILSRHIVLRSFPAWDLAEA